MEIVTIFHIWCLNQFVFFVKQELKKQIQDCQARNEGLALQTLKWIRTVRSFKAEKDEVRRYNEALDQMRTLKRRSGTYSSAFSLIRRVRCTSMDCMTYLESKRTC